MTARRRLRVCVHGVVQGVGFRPFVYTTRGRPRLVRLGAQRQLRRHHRGRGRSRRTRRLPRAAASTDRRRWPSSNRLRHRISRSVGGTGFAIADTSRSDGGRTLASPDVAMCADCAAEQRDPANRRYRHAFVNCTNCGPRFTIIAVAALRPRRPPRWRASRCAPSARANTPTPPTGASTPSRSAARTAGRRCATATATVASTDGEIGAARGPGSCCATAASSRSRASADTTWPATPATSAAVAELRRRKRRGDKPFAVMVPDLPTRMRDRRRRRRRPRGCSPARSDRSC